MNYRTKNPDRINSLEYSETASLEHDLCVRMINRNMEFDSQLDWENFLILIVDDLSSSELTA